MKRTVLLFTAFALLLAAGITVFAGCSPEDFTGSRVKNPDAYLLDIERMQGRIHTRCPCGQAILCGWSCRWRKALCPLTSCLRAASRSTAATAKGHPILP